MTNAILLIGAGYLQIPAVHIAHELGLWVIITDKNLNAPAMALADEPIELDTSDYFHHMQLGEQLSKRQDIKLRGVFTQGHSCEVAVAAAAQAANLPGLWLEKAWRIARKDKMREVLYKAQIPQPLSDTFINYKEAERLWQSFPCVIKPIDASGSRGITICYDRIRESDFWKAMNESHEKTVIIEEKLEPIEGEIAEQSVETIWQGGRGHWLNWVDRPFDFSNGHAIELGHYNPAIHSFETQKQVEEMVLRAGEALGMTTGIFKCDMMLTKNGPRILETTARLSGGFDAQYTSPLAHGVNYIHGAMQMALGKSAPLEDFVPRWYRHAVALSAFPKPGKVISIDGIESAKQITGVEHVISRVEIGNTIRPYEDCTARPLFVIASGDTREQAIESARCGLAAIKIETE